jgi:release factor glutamine methyltransferase
VTIHQAILHGKRILAEGGIDQARWQSERILSLALQKDRSKLYAELDRELTTSEHSSFNLILQKRAAHYPLAYLEGVQEFYGRDFVVNPSVLIPRPETEEIIRAALDLRLAHNPMILDLGSGSGNIAITLALELSGAIVIALEKSSSAIKVLQQNRKGAVLIVRGDFYFLNFSPDTFDLVTANLPYVEKNEYETLSPETAWEPREALLVHSLEDSYRAVMKQVSGILKEDGYLVMEFGFDQVDRLKKTLSSVAGLHLRDIRTDQQGIPRVLVLQKRS